jgi:hypothetical protein
MYEDKASYVCFSFPVYFFFSYGNTIKADTTPQQRKERPRSFPPLTSNPATTVTAITTGSTVRYVPGFLFLWRTEAHILLIFQCRNSRILEHGAVRHFSEEVLYIQPISFRASAVIARSYVIDGDGNVVEERTDQDEVMWSTHAECAFDESKMSQVAHGNLGGSQACVRMNCDFMFEGDDGNYTVGKINTIPFKH